MLNLAGSGLDANVASSWWTAWKIMFVVKIA